MAGLFAGIAGIEKGLAEAGHTVTSLCELDPAARAVLAEHFPGVSLTRSVRALDRLPDCQLLAAGFPCQSLSQAGGTDGIAGGKSAVVKEVFRLIRKTKRKPRWVLLENVPFMLRLHGGAAITYLTGALESLGYTWAYRTVDTRAWGIPQRRQRVLILASRSGDPRPVLFCDDAGDPPRTEPPTAYGFYWTEGNNGLGWAVDAVPTLKSGSGFGIPSPPAIWLPPERSIVTPDIRDAERLQGFPPGWTEPAEPCRSAPRGVRWRLVGNAVSVPVSRWVGERLLAPGVWTPAQHACDPRNGWPRAAWGANGKVYSVECSAFPVATPPTPLRSFLRHPTRPLSARATSGFLCRVRASTLNIPPGFLKALERHLRRMDPGGEFPTEKPRSKSTR